MTWSHSQCTQGGREIMIGFTVVVRHYLRHFLDASSTFRTEVSYPHT
jgi:hypothetical protein